jgi:D-hexose-6-phosphate mutarotase
LPALEITTPWSRAEIYPHGATVTQFQKHSESPVLFLSQFSRYEAGAPIRGGVPIVFPWFGKPAAKTVQHGFARTSDWELKELTSAPDGSVSVRLSLPNCAESPDCAGCVVEYVVTVREQLRMEFIVSNQASAPVTFEDLLHSYFAVADVSQVRVAGLKDGEYLDATDGRKPKTDVEQFITISGELDRAYLKTTGSLEIYDALGKRVIRLDKQGSQSTVVWNPGSAKAKAMADFGDEEYRQMLCVETGNVLDDRVTLQPGATHRLQTQISTHPL